MQAEILFVFPSAMQARKFVLAEKITSFGFSSQRSTLRCVCTQAQAETAICLFHATMLEARPLTTTTRPKGLVKFG